MLHQITMSFRNKIKCDIKVLNFSEYNINTAFYS